jgi:hypothetical protein
MGSITIDHQIPAPDGLPISIRVQGAKDKTALVNLTIGCERTDPAFHKWQLKTFERIKEAHTNLVNDYERQVARAQIQAGIEIQGRPPAENRAVEIEELTKWAIKTMRIKPFNFNAVVRQEQQEEIDPVISDAYAPIMRFFQDAFEWHLMSYILYPYFWGRRDSYGYRSNLIDNDPLHQKFLRAGAARVIVSVTPGYEERVLYYLDTQGGKDKNGTPLTELSRIGNDSKRGSSDVWLEVLLNKNDNLVAGSGTLQVKKDEAEVILSADSLWLPQGGRDIGREIIIDGDFYEITNVDVKLKAGKKITDADFFGDNIGNNYDSRKLTISPVYRLADNQAASYAVGSVRVGKPWTVRVPTSLVTLTEGMKKLYKDIDNKVLLT